MEKRKHTNPNGSVGNYASIGNGASISDNARIGNGDKTPYPVCMCRLASASRPGWVVTMTAQNMQVGCQFHALDDWWAFTDGDISQMDHHALAWWRENRPVLEAIARARGWL